MKQLMREAIITLLLLLHVLATAAQVSFSPKLQAYYDKIDTARVNLNCQRPVIGLTTTLENNSLMLSYISVDAIVQAGGIPYHSVNCRSCTHGRYCETPKWRAFHWR